MTNGLPTSPAVPGRLLVVFVLDDTQCGSCLTPILKGAQALLKQAAEEWPVEGAYTFTSGESLHCPGCAERQIAGARARAHQHIAAVAERNARLASV